MLKIPKKSFFENENSYLKKVSQAFEQQAHMDPINAYYAALFFYKSSKLKMGDYRTGNGPDLIVSAINRLLKQSGDVTVPGNIKEMIDKLKANG